MSHEIAASPEDAVKRLELEVERRRDRLSSTLRTLRTEIEDAAEWRHWYERYPLAFLAGAALTGWVAGRLIFSQRD